MNREKRDKIPSMQVSFIDAICIQLYEVGGPSAFWGVFHCRFSFVHAIAVADPGGPVGALLAAAGRLPEEPPALEAFGWRLWEGTGWCSGVTPASISCDITVSRKRRQTKRIQTAFPYPNPTFTLVFQMTRYSLKMMESGRRTAEDCFQEWQKPHKLFGSFPALFYHSAIFTANRKLQTPKPVEGFRRTGGTFVPNRFLKLPSAATVRLDTVETRWSTTLYFLP